MRRFVAIILAFSLALLSIGAFADTLDLSVLKDNKLIDVEINNDGNAFIESIIGHTNFTHENSIEDYPSYVYSDIIIGDYYSADPITFWRLWISYSAAKYLGITSITLSLDDSEYTFTNVGNKDHMTDYGTNVRENPHITFGGNNLSFWLALLLKWEGLEDKTEMFDMSMKMTLHGTTKDITVDVPGYAMADLAVLGELYLSMAGMETLLDVDGNEVSVVNNNAESSGTTGT